MPPKKSPKNMPVTKKPAVKKTSNKTKSNKKLIINAVIALIIIAVSWFFDTQYHFISRLFENQYITGENELAMHFVDVGQGDCIILQLPDGKNMIIDGGRISSKQKILDYISNINITTFDYVMLTHTDSDHVGSLDDVILNTNVKKLYVPDVTDKQITTNVYKDFLEAIITKEIPESNILPSLTGEIITSDAGYEIVFFTPSPQMHLEVRAGNANTVSPIIILYYSGRSVMFTGDATEESEQYFLEVIQSHSVLKYKNVDVDILKVAHHGSKHSSTADFLAVVKPEISVICVGAGNTYGHPHIEALERITKYSNKILRSDFHGDIRISLMPQQSGAAEIIIHTEKQPPDSITIKFYGTTLLYILFKHINIVV